MPRYRTEFGVVVDIPEEKAARMNGLTPIDVPSPPRKRRTRKTTATENNTETKTGNDSE